MRILLVEDAEDDAVLIQHVLKRNGVDHAVARHDAGCGNEFPLLLAAFADRDLLFLYDGRQFQMTSALCKRNRHKK